MKRPNKLRMKDLQNALHREKDFVDHCKNGDQKDNPQVIEMRLRAEGRVEILDAVIRAIRGDVVDLHIFAYSFSQMQLPIETQKQVPTEFAWSDEFHKSVEICLCPFCQAEIIGRWKDETRQLIPAKTCRHFSDFIAGANGRPTAFFKK